jgi:hypothetical protein
MPKILIKRSGSWCEDDLTNLKEKTKKKNHLQSLDVNGKKILNMDLIENFSALKALFKLFNVPYLF